jgi:hypothetical protein
LTVGTAIAATNWPNSFTSGAVVYGANAASSDATQANSIANYLESKGSSSNFELGDTITEDEVPLRSDVVFSGSKFNSDGILDSSDLDGLLDEKISWDDGTGSEDYDIKEQLRVTDAKMKVLTTLDDEDLDGPALSNEMALSYRLVFEDALNTSGVGTDDADDLFLTILGKQYEISGMTNTSITVLTSEDYSLGTGESVTVEGVTYTVEAIGSTSVLINGQTVSEDSTKKVSGLKVRPTDIFYSDDGVDNEKVTLKIGSDIEKTYEDGDEYIGEDEDDPLWIWDIYALAETNGYIGVNYNVNINDADDDIAGDSIKYVGDSYVFPENFAQIKLDGLTDVDYETISIEFAEVDLYSPSDTSTVAEEDAKVIKITGPADSITVNGEETSEMYIFYANNATDAGGKAFANGSINVYYKDVDGDYTPTNKARFTKQYNNSAVLTIADSAIATITVDDTVLDIRMSVTTGTPAFKITDPLENNITLAVSGTAITSTAGTFEKLGTTAEDADANDVTVDGTDVSTKEHQIMNAYGMIVGGSSGIESDADADELEFQVPSERVYGIVSASLIAGAGSSGNMVFTDNEKTAWQNENVVLVGGSCINSAVVKHLTLLEIHVLKLSLLLQTVGEGKFLIKK